jgi:hypothetical protein
MYTKRLMSFPRRLLAMALVASLLALFSRNANADDAPTSNDRITDDIDGYYAGETRSAYGVMGLSALSVGGGAVLVTRNTDFARGLGWPLLVLGAVEGVGALFYSFQVNAEAHHYRESFAANPSAFRDEEIAHMRGTTKRFVFYQATELGLTLAGAGVATYGFAANKDAFKGAGIGVFAIGLPFLVIDAVNQGRASRYLDHVQRLDAPASPDENFVSRGPDARVFSAATPFFVSYGGSF